MAEYRMFPSSGRSVLVEVDAGSGGSASGLTELFGVIAEVADACGDALSRLPDQKRPAEMQVAFGLRALTDGSMAVPLDTAQANFAVTVTWSSGGGAAEVVSGLTKPPAM